MRKWTKWCPYCLSNPNKRNLTLSAPVECLQVGFNRGELKDWCSTCCRQRTQVSIAMSSARELGWLSHSSRTLSKKRCSKCPVTKNLFTKPAINSLTNIATENYLTTTTKTRISRPLWLAEVATKALNKNHFSLEVAKEQVNRLQPEQSQVKGT